MPESNIPSDTAKPLQFETAEFGSAQSVAGEMSCSVCKRPLTGVYYEINGQRACANCKDAAIEFLSGSSVTGFFRAGIFGLIAGLVGCVIWYAVRALTGYEAGLISILVGVMVGVAVRNGSRNKGGWLYQGMAMIITYGSIVTSYVPDIVNEIRANDNQNAFQQIPTAVLAVFAWILAWFAPFLALPENIIGLFIIGIGVYEAWQINRRRPLSVAGPYNLSVPVSSETPVAGTSAPFPTT